MSPFDLEKTMLVMALPLESQGLFESQGIDIQYTGVGKINSTMNLTKMIMKKRPKHILNLGSAGSRHFDIGTLLEVESTIRREPVLPWMQKTLNLKTFSDLTRVSCASADTIEVGDAALQWQLMDMEIYSLVHVSHEFNIPISSVKFVTDNSDKNLRRDWDSQLKSCAEKLLEFYLSLK